MRNKIKVGWFCHSQCLHKIKNSMAQARGNASLDGSITSPERGGEKKMAAKEEEQKDMNPSRFSFSMMSINFWQEKIRKSSPKLEYFLFCILLWHQKQPKESRYCE